MGDVLRDYVGAMHLADRNLRRLVGHAELSDLGVLGRRLQEEGGLSGLDTAVLAGVVRRRMQDFVRSSQPLSKGSLMRAIRGAAKAERYAYRPETIWRLVNDRGVERLHVGSVSYRMGEREMAMICAIEARGVGDVDALRVEHPGVDVEAVLGELEKVGIVSRAPLDRFSA